ncbi:MAG: aromatic amino acid transport family protein [Candidatus Endonucleobacter bathymodioli]|uniref:Aromatic amino acid transport family protein n=1 Tax=Candidatus Endonucleibacter bathymodioli TaxID=539814 RepID=A0AA90STA3_9GAMM|nr:aromatic amino acid transport family protein [Candidatus Endonucleobacter bathymodioli]
MESNAVTTKTQQVNGSLPWTHTDTKWSLSIFGAAVGAGILFLPINAGIGGIWSLIALASLLSPLTFITHRNILRFCLSSKNPVSDFNEAANEHFGKTGGLWVTIAYFAFIFPIVMAYSIALTNTVESMIINQLGWQAPERWLLSLVLVLILVGIVACNEKIILNVTAILVYPLCFVLTAISVYLIPQWSLEQFRQPVTVMGITKGFLSTLPILIFSLAYIPVCSALSQSYRSKIKNKVVVRMRTEQITVYGTSLLMLITLFFTFSCVLSLPPEELMMAKQNNISVMTLFSLRSHDQWFAAATSIVAITAIGSSFLGYYLGAREGLSGLIRQAYARAGNKGILGKARLNRISNIFYVLSLWLVGYLNLGIIDIMGVVAAPLMAVVLYLMPVYAVYQTDALKQYRSKVDFLTLTVGLVCICSYIIANAVLNP